MAEQVPEDVKRERITRLVDLVQRHAAEHNAALVGTVQEVLVEGPSRTDPSVLRGRTRGNKTTLFGATPPRASWRWSRSCDRPPRRWAAVPPSPPRPDRWRA